MPIQKDLCGVGLVPAAAKYIAGDVETGVTATGSSSQANSYALKYAHTVFSTTAANTGARLRADLIAGDSGSVQNNGASTLFLYPPVGGSINGGSANAKVDVATLKGAHWMSTNGLDFSVIVGA